MLTPLSGENVQAVSPTREVMTYRKWNIYELAEGVYFARNQFSTTHKPVFFGFGADANQFTASEILEAVIEFIEEVEG